MAQLIESRVSGFVGIYVDGALHSDSPAVAAALKSGLSLLGGGTIPGGAAGDVEWIGSRTPTNDEEEIALIDTIDRYGMAADSEDRDAEVIWTTAIDAASVAEFPDLLAMPEIKLN